MKVTMTNTPETGTPKDTGSVVKKLKYGCGLLVLLLVIMVVQMVASNNQYKETMDRQKKELASIERRIKEAKGEVDALPKASESEAQAARRQDTTLGEAFVKRLLTWQGTEGYKEIRTWLSKTYGIKADDDLLTTFMPELSDHETKNSDMKYDSAQMILKQDKEGTRSYMALCEVTNRIDGNKGYGQVAVFYSVSPDGVLSELSAYTLAS